MSCACTTCHVIIREGLSSLPPATDEEDDMLDKAVEASLKALMYDATLSEAYAALGLAYFDRKELDEAVNATRKAIELDPMNQGFKNQLQQLKAGA